MKKKDRLLALVLYMFRGFQLTRVSASMPTLNGITARVFTVVGVRPRTTEQLCSIEQEQGRQGGSCCYSLLQKWTLPVVQEAARHDFLRGGRTADVSTRENSWRTWDVGWEEGWGEKEFAKPLNPAQQRNKCV